MHVSKPPRTSEYSGIWTMDLRPRIETMAEIAKRAARVYGLAPDRLRVKSRIGKYARARHYICYHAYEQPHLSCTQIAGFLGIDHTTVLYGHFAHALRHGLPRARGMSMKNSWRRKLQYEGPEPE